MCEIHVEVCAHFSIRLSSLSMSSSFCSFLDTNPLLVSVVTILSHCMTCLFLSFLCLLKNRSPLFQRN
jgi:hypothetical protein